MDVLLKPDLEKFVAEKVRAGQYDGPSDVINEALEVLQEQEQFTPEHEAFLRREVRGGLDQLDNGQYSELDAERIIAEERQRLAHAKEPH